jgi:hypothetical protein
MPTSNWGGITIAAVLFRMLESTPGAILQPHPPPWEREVKRGSVVMVTEVDIQTVIQKIPTAIIGVQVTNPCKPRCFP